MRNTKFRRKSVRAKHVFEQNANKFNACLVRIKNVVGNVWCLSKRVETYVVYTNLFVRCESCGLENVWPKPCRSDCKNTKNSKCKHVFDHVDEKTFLVENRSPVGRLRRLSTSRGPAWSTLGYKNMQVLPDT